ncbi:MAG: dihydrolipoyl dehydrogenase [Chloroflexota bacterium]
MAVEEQRYDFTVIGAGPGGYVAALRAAQLGLKTACIEKEPALGGTCLNVGCIPSKALLDSTELLHAIRHKAATHGIAVERVRADLQVMQRRKESIVQRSTRGIEYLFRKNAVTWIRGTARLVEPDRIEVTDAGGSRSTVTSRHICIATGSAPVPFPGVPFDEERVLSSTGALALEEVPEHLIVIGGGAIGLELGSVWLRLGAHVTILELMPTILPGMDGEIARQAEQVFRHQGFDIRTGVRVSGIERHQAGVRVFLQGGDSLDGDYVLVAIGRQPYTEGLGAAELGIRLDERGVIRVDLQYRTDVGQIYAIGDVIGGAMLAHKAMEEGVAVAELAAGKAGMVNYDAVATVVYTSPEIASVGRPEEELRREGHELRVGKFPFTAAGRARTLEEPDGLVKVIADARSGRLLGVHILGPHASDLIAEAVLAMEFQASAEDIAVSVHAHPTLPEAMKEAALAALGRALHI